MADHTYPSPTDRRTVTFTEDGMTTGSPNAALLVYVLPGTLAEATARTMMECPRFSIRPGAATWTRADLDALAQRLLDADPAELPHSAAELRSFDYLAGEVA